MRSIFGGASSIRSNMGNTSRRRSSPQAAPLIGEPEPLALAEMEPQCGSDSVQFGRFRLDRVELTDDKMSLWTATIHDVEIERYDFQEQAMVVCLMAQQWLKDRGFADQSTWETNFKATFNTDPAEGAFRAARLACIEDFKDKDNLRRVIERAGLESGGPTCLEIQRLREKLQLK